MNSGIPSNRPGLAPRFSFVVTAVLALLLAAALPARAEVVHEVRIGNRRVSGEVASPGEVLRIPFRLLEGSTLKLQIKADRGGALRPDLRLLGTDRLPDGTASFRTSKKGDRVDLRGYEALATGLFYLEVRGADGTTGGWTVTAKVKTPKKALLGGSLGGEGEVATFGFPGPGGATGTALVKPARGSHASPVFLGLQDGEGDEVLTGGAVPAGKGFLLRDFQILRDDSYSLLVGSADGVPGDVVVKISFKLPRFPTVDIDASEIVTNPVPTSIDPAGGLHTQSFEATLAVDFAQPGARIEFSIPQSVVVVPPNLVVVDGTSAKFPLNLSSFRSGAYDVAIINPDGGRGSLAGAFTVENAAAAVDSVLPAYGYDDEVVAVSILGQWFVPGAAVRLERNAETIDATAPVVGTSVISTSFDLRGAALGAWDVVVANPGTPETVLAGAFEVLPALSIAAMTPGDDADGDPVAAVVTGTGFREGIVVSLVPGVGTTGSVVQGTGVSVKSGGELGVVFDTSSCNPGLWDLVLELPDGHEARLDGALRKGGILGDPVHSITFNAPADAPFAVAVDEATGEYAVAWVEFDNKGFILQWNVVVQRLDASGSPLGLPVKVGVLGYSEKKSVAIGFDPDRAEYLVAWGEVAQVTISKGGVPHPKGGGTVPVYEVQAQRLKASDLTTVGKIVQVSDHTAFTAWSNSWFLDEFDSYRPSVAYDRATGLWQLAWMQEWDAGGTYSFDDFNVFQRSFDPVTGTLGSVAAVDISPYHEGAPSLAWDPVGGRVILAFAARNGSDRASLDIRLASGASGKVVAEGNGDDLLDPHAVVDPDSKRVLVTWVRAPSGSVRSVEAVLVEESDLETVVGGVETVALGDPTAEFPLDHVFPVPVYDTTFDQGMIFYSWSDGKSVGVEGRRVDTAGSKGLVLKGNPIALSDGKTPAAASIPVYSPHADETAVFWLTGLTWGSIKDPGAVVPGTLITGTDLWVQRLK